MRGIAHSTVLSSLGLAAVTDHSDIKWFVRKAGLPLVVQGLAGAVEYSLHGSNMFMYFFVSRGSCTISSIRAAFGTRHTENGIPPEQPMCCLCNLPLKKSYIHAQRV